MINLSKTIELQKNKMRVYDSDGNENVNRRILGILEVLLKDTKRMNEQQQRQLIEQQKIHCRTLEIDKKLSEMVDNQNDIKKSVDNLIERMG